MVVAQAWMGSLFLYSGCRCMEAKLNGSRYSRYPVPASQESRRPVVAAAAA